jgi:two-component system cell cycle sensor histidine kinase/response regulator CckA
MEVAGDILIVEGDDAYRMTLSKMVAMLGYHVVSVASGDEAIDILPASRFHTVLMDFDLPDVDGITLASRIKNYSSHTRIILMTCSGKNFVPPQSGTNIDKILAKPFSIAELNETVRLCKLNPMLDSDSATIESQ